MDENRKEDRSEGQWEDRAPATTMRWLVILSVVLFGAAVFAAGYAIEQNAAVADLKQQNQAMNSAEQQMKSQIDSLGAKLAQMTAPPPPAPATEASATGAPGAAGTAAKHPASTVPDRRMKRMQTQLAEQQKELKATRDDLAAARTDLEGKLGSTRDELNGSIARTHDELVSLEKRGERLFYEFDLSKSKNFEREGPIQVSLRKADSKHQSYDLMMLVDDHQLSKKKVDLYEPIWLHEGDMPQPVQVVVNRIEKDHIHGYVSAPKFRESELAANANQQPSATDSTSRTSSSPTSNSPSNNSSTSTSNSATVSQGQ
ncbi:MAG TPA: hypothetical protein VGT24_11420 [Candidatus Acidoferrales bacterium]|nr:hypothetical protein [Candidatus Acidoferrales bacterium]